MVFLYLLLTLYGRVVYTYVMTLYVFRGGSAMNEVKFKILAIMSSKEKDSFGIKIAVPADGSEYYKGFNVFEYWYTNKSKLKDLPDTLIDSNFVGKFDYIPYKPTSEKAYKRLVEFKNNGVLIRLV